MFTYCGNNPVSRKDDGGEFWNIVIGAAVGAVASAVVTAIDSYSTSGKVDWGQVAISAAVGGISGGVAATGLGPIAQAGISAGASFLGSLASDGYDSYKTYKKTGQLPNAGAVGKSLLRATGAAAIGFGGSVSGSGAGEGVSRGIKNKGAAMLLSSKGTVYWTRAQARYLAKQGKILINTARGISSVVGTLFTWPTSTALSMGL